MQEVSFEEVLNQIVVNDPRYARDAYFFVRDALDYTQKLVNKSNAGRDTVGRVRHVTPTELLNGIRDYALSQYGPMAIMVLEEWGVRSCADFGEMVFSMIEHSLLAKTDTDTREGFKDGYTFDEVFRQPFLPAAQKQNEPAKA